MIGEKRVARFRVLFFIYVTVCLLLFAAAARGGATPQETTAAATSADTTTSQEPERRALPVAFDGVFPGSDYLGPTPLIGVPDTDPVYPLTKAVWAIAPSLKDARIKVYGWVNPGISVSTSNKSNIPESYAIVPNRIEVDQGVLRIERVPDTVQTDHVELGISPHTNVWNRLSLDDLARVVQRPASQAQLSLRV